MKKHHGNPFMIGAMLGSAIGAVSAMLFSKKGHPIQKNAMKKWHQFETYIKEFVSKKKKTPTKKRRKAVARKTH